MLYHQMQIYYNYLLVFYLLDMLDQFLFQEYNLIHNNHLLYNLHLYNLQLHKIHHNNLLLYNYFLHNLKLYICIQYREQSNNQDVYIHNLFYQNNQIKISRIKKYTDLPICVGFGIKSPEDAKSISLSADGVVVGSAIIETVQKGASESEVSDFISSLSKSVHSN